MDYRIEQLRHQLREDPSSRVFYQLGELLRREGSVEEAVEVLRQGLTHHPRYVAAWVSLGRSLLQRESFPEAEVAFARALELDPENAVAARMIGESALGRGDLVRAVKALKLARALSPRDPSLEEQIATVEARLGEQGLLEGPAPARPAAPPLEVPPEEPSAAEPAAAPETVAAEVVAEAPAIPAEPEPMAVTQPFVPFPPAGPAAVAVEPEPGATVTEAPAAPAEVAAPELVFFAATHEDPFAVAPRGDTGVFLLGEDVFGGEPPAPLAGAAPVVEAVPTAVEVGSLAALESLAAAFEAPPPAEPEVGPFAGAVPAQVEEIPPAALPAEAPPLGAAAMTVSEVATVPGVPLAALMARSEPIPPEPTPRAPVGREEGEEEAEPRGVPELPVSTLTLARLALDQGDRELADKTLLAVLERDPGNAEAARLLAGLRGEPVQVTAARLAAVRVAALHGWLERFRLAAERLGP